MSDERDGQINVLRLVDVAGQVSSLGRVGSRELVGEVGIENSVRSTTGQDNQSATREPRRGMARVSAPAPSAAGSGATDQEHFGRAAVYRGTVSDATSSGSTQS